MKVLGICNLIITPRVYAGVDIMDDAASVQSGPPKQIIVENTHITTPEGYGEVRWMQVQAGKSSGLCRAQSVAGTTTVTNGVLQAYVFKQQKVQALLKKAIADNIEGQQYDPVKGSKVSTDWNAVSRWEKFTNGQSEGFHRLCSKQSRLQKISCNGSRPWVLTDINLSFRYPTSWAVDPMQAYECACLLTSKR